MRDPKAFTRLLLSALVAIAITSCGPEAPESTQTARQARALQAAVKPTDGSPGSVQTAIDQAANGDTVAFPANGNFTWSSGITCKKVITIEGNGSTITHGAGSSDLFNLTTSTAGHLTVQNLKFKPGGATGRYISLGEVSGAQGIILHDLNFNIPNFQLTTAITANVTGGMAYNCVFESTDPGGSSGPGSGSGCLQLRSPKNWYDADTFGKADTNGDQNFYVEDCTFRDMYNQAIDIDDNTRLVLRHNQMINSQCVIHGITSMWGGRQFEAYSNNFIYEKRNGVWVNTNRYFWARAGTGRIHDNSVQRIDSGGYWGAAKPSWLFIDEPLTRPGSGNGGRCETQSQYPGTRWPGTGTDGTKHPSGQIVSPSAVDPFYIWNNTGTGATSWSTNDQSGYNCNNGPTSNVFRLGRDIILAADPNYAGEFPYPHPWRGGGSVTPTPTGSPTATLPPQPTATRTPTPTATQAPTATATASAVPTATASATQAPTATQAPSATATPSAPPAPTPITLILHEGDTLNIYVRPPP